MKSLKECQAEVFRRSEEKLRRRKLFQKRMLGAGLPLILCAAIFITAILWNNGASQSQEYPAAKTAQQITVQLNNETLSYTKPEQVQPILNLLYSLSLSYGATTPSPDKQTAVEKPILSASDCLITVFADNKEKTEYYLISNQLVNACTGYSVALTQEQLTQLYALLGIFRQ